MYPTPPLSEQQNFALVVICTYAVVGTVMVFGAGLLGFLRRQSWLRETNLN